MKKKGSKTKPVKGQFIADDNKRVKIFRSRKNVLLKKASELSGLTGCEVMVMIASENKKVYTYSTKSIREFIVGREKNVIDCMKDIYSQKGGKFESLNTTPVLVECEYKGKGMEVVERMFNSNTQNNSLSKNNLTKSDENPKKMTKVIKKKKKKNISKEKEKELTIAFPVIGDDDTLLSEYGKEDKKKKKDSGNNNNNNNNAGVIYPNYFNLYNPDEMDEEMLGVNNLPKGEWRLAVPNAPLIIPSQMIAGNPNMIYPQFIRPIRQQDFIRSNVQFPPKKRIPQVNSNERAPMKNINNHQFVRIHPSLFVGSFVGKTNSDINCTTNRNVTQMPANNQLEHPRNRFILNNYNTRKNKENPQKKRKIRKETKS